MGSIFILGGTSFASSLPPMATPQVDLSKLSPRKLGGFLTGLGFSAEEVERAVQIQTVKLQDTNLSGGGPYTSTQLQAVPAQVTTQNNVPGATTATGPSSTNQQQISGSAPSGLSSPPVLQPLPTTNPHPFSASQGTFGLQEAAAGVIQAMPPPSLTTGSALGYYPSAMHALADASRRSAPTGPSTAQPAISLQAATAGPHVSTVAPSMSSFTFPSAPLHQFNGSQQHLAVTIPHHQTNFGSGGPPFPSPLPQPPITAAPSWGIPSSTGVSWGGNRTAQPSPHHTLPAPSQVPPILAQTLYGSVPSSGLQTSSNTGLLAGHGRGGGGVSGRARGRGGLRVVTDNRILYSTSWYVLPDPEISRLNTHAKHACAEASLYKVIKVPRRLDRFEMHGVLVDNFPTALTGINWAKQSYEYLQYDKDYGDTLQKAGLNAYPTADEIASAYERKRVAVVRLLQGVDVPGFWDTYRWVKKNLKKSKAIVSDSEFEDEEPTSESLWECPACKMEFLPDSVAEHAEVCPGNKSTKEKRRSRSISAPDLKKKKTRTRTKSTQSREARSRQIRSPSPADEERSDDDGDGDAEGELEQEPGTEDSDDDFIPKSKPKRSSANHGTTKPSAAEDDGVGDGQEGGGDRREHQHVGGGSQYGLRSKARLPEDITVCPFCDEPLPLNPTSALLKLIRTVASQPTTKPRASEANAHALEASITATSNVCVRHRQENALATEVGHWPLVDFKTLPERLEKHVKTLQDILEEPQSNHCYDLIVSKIKDGLRINTMQGKVEASSLTGCGYYGPKGFLIISSALEALGLRHPIRSALTRPLSSSDFWSFVLIPSAAALLIQEDLPDLDLDDVWEVLDSSRDFGLCFNADDDDINE